MSVPGERVNRRAVYRAPAGRARAVVGTRAYLGLALGEDPTLRMIGVGRRGAPGPWTFEVSHITRCPGVCECSMEGVLTGQTRFLLFTLPTSFSLRILLRNPVLTKTRS